MNLLAHTDTADLGNHHTMMGFAGSESFGFFSYHFILMSITWILLIILLVVLIKYFWTKTPKK